MFIQNWKKEILTIPNLLSLLRLILIPVSIVLYLNAREPVHFVTAGSIVALSCLTDALDGWIARRFNMISTLGKILDPLADKLTQFALTVCLSLRHAVLHPVLVLFVIKELFQLTLGILYLLQGKMLPGALMAGKICTTVFFISLITLVLFPRLPQILVSGIAFLNFFLLMFSFSCYCRAYWGKHPKLRNISNNDPSC